MQSTNNGKYNEMRYITCRHQLVLVYFPVHIFSVFEALILTTLPKKFHFFYKLINKKLSHFVSYIFITVY